MTSIAFKPVARTDLPMLKSWMERAHWREWWGESAVELQYIVDMIEGRDTTEPYIISVDARPVGYIQVWHIGPHQTADWTSEFPWLAALPADAVGVDISIGEEGNLSRGIGSAALAAFVALLRQRGHTTIIIDPDPANERAVRAYAKAGFKLIPELAGRTGGVLIMRHAEGKTAV